MSTVTVHGYTISHTSSVVNTVLLYVVIGATVILRYRTRRHRVNAALVAGERLRPLLTIPMDTALTVVFVGLILFDLATRDVWHALSSAAGVAMGIGLGLLRARVQYVRAVPAAQSIVMRRSPIEYAVLVLLLAVRVAEDYVVRSHTVALTCVLGALMALALAQSATRSYALVRRFRRDAAAERAIAIPKPAL